MEWIISNAANLLDIVMKVVAVAAAIAAVAPNGEKASGVIASARKVLDLLALNVGNAKNSEKTPE
mgnify:FL=1|tara:strand:- start:242 stop:436 length:195 start_codon:yes stop_codon:yes gene_type:complete